MSLTPVEKASEPHLGHEPIDVRSYHDPHYVQLEAERLWSKTWLLAGLCSDVEHPGDYFTFEIGRESILVVRDNDHQINAFFNVCSHRGNRLSEAGCHHAEFFSCPFHRWAFNLDGSLRGVPRADEFPQGLPEDQLELTPLKVDIWGGFVWVSMNPDVAPLTEFLGVVPEHLDPYDMAEHVLVMDETVEWHCNWKTSLDIFSETYHVIGVHPEGEAVSDDVNVQIDLYGLHSRFISPMYVPSPRVTDGTKLPQMLKDYLASEGFPVDTYTGDITTIRADVAAFKRQQSAETGLDFSKLRDEQLTADFHYNLFPNVTFNMFGEQFWLFRHRPHPTDPNRMYFDRFIFNRVPKGKRSASTSAGAVDLFVTLDNTEIEGRVGHISYKYGERSSGLLLDQDAMCLAGVQQGLQSRGFKGLWVGAPERRIRNFHHHYQRYLREENNI